MRNGSHSNWVARPKPNDAASLRLFCLPYAGGSSLIFRGWPESLPSFVEVCLIQLPGRGARLKEAPFTRLTTLVEELSAALLPYLDKPFAFFGHSMGAVLSFELTRHLRRHYDRKPLHLFVSGRTAPQLEDTDPPTYGLPEPEFIEEIRRLNGTPKEVLANPELMQFLLPILRADFEICQTYDYSPDSPLDCPLTAIGGLQDTRVRREDLEAWREQSASSFVLRMLPGDHFFLHTAQPLLLRILTQELYRYTSAALASFNTGRAGQTRVL